MSHAATDRERDAVVPPSSLFVFWPGDEPPMAEEVRVRLAEWGQTAQDIDLSPPEDTLWSFWFDLSDRPLSYLIWCEAVMGSHLLMLDSVRWRSREQEERARSCRWLVGLEGPLSLRQPAVDYQLQLRLCDAISLDWSPVVFDASSLCFRTSQDVRLLAESRTPPRSSCLYTIHKVAITRVGQEPRRYWLHTHGLERAGIPDLEMFDIPSSLLPTACELMDAVVDLWMEFGTPDPETPFVAGQQIEIAWRPWQMVAADRSGMDDAGSRPRDPSHSGYRAVLVAPPAQGPLRRSWRPPVDVLQRLLSSDATLFKTTNESRRMSQLARERWGSFGTLFASSHPSSWRFSVKLTYPMEHDPSHGEHLWFDVLSLQPGRIRGKLVSQPSFIPSLELGDVGWHSLEQLSDWRIFTPMGIFDPETADSLLETSSFEDVE